MQVKMERKTTTITTTTEAAAKKFTLNLSSAYVVGLCYYCCC